MTRGAPQSPLTKARPRPLALDLFCGAGGASAGLHRAGFDVVGVDIKPQPRYPFPFVQADALNCPFDLHDFDLIWASPPCQFATAAAARLRQAGNIYPNFIAAVRTLLAGHPVTVIENVPPAVKLGPLRPDLRLNGWMFPELRVIRERVFELSFFTLAPPSEKPRDLMRRGYVTVAGHGVPSYARARGLTWTAKDCRDAMGIEWMSRAELAQAVPPAYAEFIARAALPHLQARRGAA